MKTALSILRTVFYTLALGALAQVPQGFAATPAAGISLQVYAGLTITGVVGSNYVVQYMTDMSPTNNWQTLTNLALPSSPYLWFDTSCPATVQRFYRVVVPAVPTNSIPSNPNPTLLVWINPGTFTMGSPSTEKDRGSNEGPQTQVTISKGFWMSKYEVTQEEYQTVMGNNPSHFTGDMNRPVEQAKWIDATNYCGKITQQERSAGRLPAGYEYRLPTEAEWEYACRAGTTTRFSYGSDLDYTLLKNYAWYWDNSYTTVKPAGVSELYVSVEFNNGRYYTTQPVGQKLPNAWGLYDMHGNVREWCLDWYGTYPGGSVTDPRGPNTSTMSSRVFRGGGWHDDGSCRSAGRIFNWPDLSDFLNGFRVVLAPGQ